MAASRRYLLVLIGVLWTVLSAQAQTVVPDSTDVMVDEDAGTVTITLNHVPPPPSGLWGGSYATMDGTATAGVDYTAVTANVLGTNSDNSISFMIDILDDGDYESDETFTVMLTGLTPATPDFTVTVTIKDNETPPVNLTEIDDAMIKETIGNFCFPISRSDSTTHAFNVSISTMDSDTGMSATEGEDYIPFSNYTVSFAENEDSVTVCIPIINDVIAEDSEKFHVWIYVIEHVFVGTSYWVHWAYSVHFYVTILDNDTPDNFNCRRGISQPCLNGGTCMLSDGTCACPAGFEGENCGINTTAISMGCASCVNGTCVNGVCVCDGGFAGESCDQKAYFHQCEAHGFSVCITPFSVDTFNGTIYVVGKDDVAECNLDLAPIPSDPDDDLVDWCVGYAAFIPFNGTCGELGPNVDGELTTFELQLRVQYSAQLRNTDEIVTLKCQYNNDSLLVSTGVLNVEPDSDSANVQREEGDLVPAEMTVTDVNGLPLSSPLIIGTIIKVYISVDEVDAFGGVVVNRIIANNGRDGADYRFLVLYDYGCFPPDAFGIIVKGPIYVPDSERHTVCFEIEVFIFIHDADEPNPKLEIDIEFTVFEDSADAMLHTCSTGRRKRQTIGSRDEKMGTTVYLINPKAVQSELLQADTCSTSKWLVPTIIGLGVVAITMAIVIIVLTVAVCRHYQEKKIP